MTEQQIHGLIPKHVHSHSVFECCPNCMMMGVNLPDNWNCGNCGKEGTYRYYPSCCLLALLSTVNGKSVGDLLAEPKDLTQND